LTFRPDVPDVPSIDRLIRYPRLVIVASYVAIVLGSVALGTRVAESNPADLLPLLVTVGLGIGLLHHAYTSDRR